MQEYLAHKKTHHFRRKQIRQLPKTCSGQLSTSFSGFRWNKGVGAWRACRRGRASEGAPRPPRFPAQSTPNCTHQPTLIIIFLYHIFTITSHAYILFSLSYHMCIFYSYYMSIHYFHYHTYSTNTIVMCKPPQRLWLGRSQHHPTRLQGFHAKAQVCVTLNNLLVFKDEQFVGL